MVGLKSAPDEIYITCSLYVCENKHSQSNISLLEFLPMGEDSPKSSRVGSRSF